ncbi:insulinase family protein [Acidaminobacter sp. JC074]|uniref:insulinase family protein n=1 Tax=Acidaminobacter sp. JC074 TaxID=2530199 RepID=UPI001F10E924|nr:insulinase family protein [Acidaminobacter sp. JC074]
MYGFKLLDTHKVNEINSDAFVYEHEKSGAKLLHLKNTDDNKVFSIAFRTPPSDSTGVPHIIEHCVLSGSRKYKTKEPFMDMVKGSLKTFINAMTFSDKTIYPVASRNEKDFMNLMDVYLDAVFFPMIHEDKTIFMQEGWHYNLEEKDGPLKYNGVVYNEMRGAYSQPTTLLREYIGKSLYPDTTYQYSSGGNPDNITDLTYEDFKKFHEDFYHPSNAYIYLYGDGNIEDYLKHLDDYLNHFDKKEIESHIPLQKGFDKINQYDGKYSIASEESDDKKTYLSYNFVVGQGTDARAHLMGEVMKDVLVGAAAGPVKKALLDAGIGEDIMASFDGGVQLNLSIIAKNAELSQKSEFERIIRETLEKAVKEGLDKNLIESSINVSEYDMREATGFATKGIIYHIYSMNSWLYEGHPTELIAYDKEVKAIRDLIDTDYFEKYIQEKLLDNTHASVVSLSPEKGLSEKKAKADEDKLEKVKSALSDQALDDILEENKVLKSKQLTPDSKEALDTIPKLSVSDVTIEAEQIPIEENQVDDYKIVKHNIFSNDIAYVEFLFDTTMVSQEDISYIPLLADLIGKIDTKSYGYGDLNNEIYKLTGGINLSSRTYTDTNSKAFYPKMVVSGKVIVDKLEDLMRLVNVLLTETLFEDSKRIKELLLQSKSRMEMAINQRGDSYASSRLASYFLPSSHYGEKVKGFDYYWFLSDLIKNYDAQVLEKLQNVYVKLFNTNGLIISITGDDKTYDTFEKTYKSALEGLNKDAFESQSYNFDLKVKNEGIASSSNVQYCAQGFNFKALDYKYSGHMQVLKSILSADYLHDRIRAKGGAYGCGISFSDNGNVIATSYRDPNLENTFNVFDEMADYIDELSLDQETLTRFIIGAVSRLDSAMTPKGKGTYGTANHISGITQVMIQEEREAILNIKLEDIKSLAKLVREVMSKGYRVAYGNDVKIKNSDVFDSVKNLND